MNRFVESLKQDAEDARILGKEAEQSFLCKVEHLFHIRELTKDHLQEILSCMK